MSSLLDTNVLLRVVHKNDPLHQVSLAAILSIISIYYLIALLLISNGDD